jgi:hypothetical protein
VIIDLDLLLIGQFVRLEQQVSTHVFEESVQFRFALQQHSTLLPNQFFDLRNKASR